MATPTPAVPLDQRPVRSLRGAGKKVVERLQKLGIRKVGDLLLHLPSRYQDRTRLTPLTELLPGAEVLVEGDVTFVDSREMPRRVLSATLSDNNATIGLVFFHFGGGLRKQLRVGVRVRCFGEVRPGFRGLEMIHPELTFPGSDGEEPLAASLTPVYPATEGLHQGTLRGLVDQVLELLVEDGEEVFQDCLPSSLREQLSLPALAETLQIIHRPDAGQGKAAGERAITRLAYEELLAHHLSLRKLRHRARQETAPVLGGGAGHSQAFVDTLPFALTPAQSRVLSEIRADMSTPVPMMRLLQGDVGCGKTVVAAAAMLEAVSAGRQAALMAPTELLAEQHFASFRDWLKPLGVAVVPLSSRLSAADRREALALLASTESAVAVGTHSLFQQDVEFRELGLVVVDEQHRFGVHQRLALREKGRALGLVPHQLVMTATPIPRTLAMTAYADLDLSVIDELPPGRTAIKTVVLPERRREAVAQRVNENCQEGRQAYWVCTLVEESDVLEAQAAEDTAAELQESLPHLRVGLAHGRQKSAERENVMAAFKQRELDVLVATTVIEVGVDVPNASIMVIENAERLGLAQLHQLRGRVGRGSRESYCLLMYGGQLSETARARLEIVRASTDGFEIAQRDLELRGPGEVLGVRQTGDLRFRVADPSRDERLFDGIQAAADDLLERHPELVRPLLRRWIGDDGRYGQV